jgi:hypothetical protein
MSSTFNPTKRDFKQFASAREEISRCAQLYGTMTQPPALRHHWSLLVLRLALAAVFVLLMVAVPWGVARWAVNGRAMQPVPLPASTMRSMDQ